MKRHLLCTLLLVLTVSAAVSVPRLLAQKTQADQPPPPSPPPTPQAAGETHPPAAVVNAADYPTLQAAADALPPSGGVLRIPPGVHELKEPLIVRSGDTRIEGAGTASHLKNLNESGAPALLIRPETIQTDPRARLWRVEACNLRISGNPQSGAGIQAIGVQEFILRNISVDRNGSHGVDMDRCTENPRIIGCNFTYNNGSGVHSLGGHDVIVSANQFEENIDALTIRDGYNLTFTGNNLDDHLRHGVVVENTYGSVISGNMIEECEGIAIILDRDCYGVAISGNSIAHHLGGGIDLRDAWGCTVTGNNFVLVHGFSVQVGSNSGRHTITGNHFTNSHIGGDKIRRLSIDPSKSPWQWDVGSGIVLEGTEDIVITGNQFSGLTTRAIEARGECRRLLVTNNLVTDHGRGLPGDVLPIDLGTPADSITEPNIVGPRAMESADSSKN